jgi:hypothetical protein
MWQFVVIYKYYKKDLDKKYYRKDIKVYNIVLEDARKHNIGHVFSKLHICANIK